MYNFQPAMGGAVAADTRRAMKAIDAALLSDSQLFVTIMEALQDADLPARRSQDVLQSVSDGLTHFLAGRAAMVTTIGKLTAIKDQSNLETVSFGCPAGLHLRTAAVETADIALSEVD